LLLARHRPSRRLRDRQRGLRGPSAVVPRRAGSGHPPDRARPMIAVLVTLAAMAGAYLLGSIPFGLLIARWFGKVDIRTVGSGNIGATNVGRVLGFKFFVVVFLLDFLKGFLPTFYWPGLARQATGLRLPDLPVLVAVAAILGHNYPVFLRFRGGKGV